MAMSGYEEKTSFKKIGDVEIFVLTDGKFAAKVGNTWRSRSNLKELEKIIEDNASGVFVMEVRPELNYSVSEPEIISIEPDKRWRTKGGTLYSQWEIESRFYHPNPATAKLQEELQRRIKQVKAEAQKEWEQHLAELKHFTLADFHAAKAAQAKPKAEG
jgi:hypothetical protein